MNQREAFEKWFNSYAPTAPELLDDCAWAAWQAATAMEREDCAKVCDHYATAIDLRGNEYIRSGDCKRAAELIRDRK